LNIVNFCKNPLPIVGLGKKGSSLISFCPLPTGAVVASLIVRI